MATELLEEIEQLEVRRLRGWPDRWSEPYDRAAIEAEVREHRSNR